MIFVIRFYAKHDISTHTSSMNIIFGHNLFETYIGRVN